jgi:hypothetical protein
VGLERTNPSEEPRVPNPKVLAIRTADLDEKADLISADPKVYFTEPHYDNFPAVLLRLEKVRMAQKKRLTAAWRCQAPKALQKEKRA